MIKTPGKLSWISDALNNPPSRQQIGEAFTLGELQQALSLLDAGKAVDTDGIAPDLHMDLLSKGSTVLLNILNSNWLSIWCQEFWRSAYVVRILKKGKDPADVRSYRPIAHTSTMGKVLDRHIADCRSWWLEEHSALSIWQAGIRGKRGNTDKCLRLSQFTSDGLESVQRRRTTATFFDFSREYDRVWRTGHQMKMSMMGVPRRFTEWLSSWFINRTARERLNGSIDTSRTFREVLLQGPVLSLLRFTMYINDLMARFENDTFESAYADDLSIARSVRNKDMIVASLQEDEMVAWSDKARLTLNTSKYEIDP